MTQHYYNVIVVAFKIICSSSSYVLLKLNMKWFLLVFVLLGFEFTIVFPDEDLVVLPNLTYIQCWSPGEYRKPTKIVAHTASLTFGKTFELIAPFGMYALRCHLKNASVEYECNYNPNFHNRYESKMKEGYFVELTIKSFHPRLEAGSWTLRGEGYEKRCNKTQLINVLAASKNEAINGACVNVVSMFALSFWTSVILDSTTTFFELTSL